MAPYTKAFRLSDGRELTSIVLDQADFDAFADELGGIFSGGTGARTGAEQVATIKGLKHLPLMARGTKTQQFFERWGVTTDLLSVIVRGHGPALYQLLKEGR